MMPIITIELTETQYKGLEHAFDHCVVKTAAQRQAEADAATTLV